MTIEQDVKNWLADEGVFREKAADENADFHFVIEFPKDNVMDVVKPKEKNLSYFKNYEREYKRYEKMGKSSRRFGFFKIVERG